ncbi:MAG: helix-turn-helix domain-containing protein [Bacteroidetes bacterium]|nr:helix-turn-helix domain-containing protein [Bacteroidota bacterium]
MKKYNCNKFKSCMVYTIAEICKMLELHIRTVQDWVKKGLIIKNPSKRPFLIEGEDIKNFLKNIASKNKITLKMGEFKCFRCNKAVKSKDGKVEIEFTNKFFGQGAQQIFIRGECEVCSGKLLRLSSTNNIIEAGFNNNDNRY